MTVSESWRAAWIFFASPASHARIVVAAKNFITVYFLGAYLLVLAAFWSYFFDRIWHAVVHALFAGLLAHLLLQLMVMVKPTLPFAAEPRKAERSAGMFGLFFVGSIAAGFSPSVTQLRVSQPAADVRRARPGARGDRGDRIRACGSEWTRPSATSSSEAELRAYTRSVRHGVRVWVVVIVPSVVLALTSSSAAAQPSDTQLAQNLKKLSIEELTQLDITTASRRVEPLAQAAAAVSVLRGEDIRRSGVTNLAEALRLADGIDVARADNQTWAISTRGFNIPTANKILVLIDGRTVYSPLFAGTFWSVQDIPLSDIDRIEVTRGPGGTVWGANAVNGVVNIITKTRGGNRGSPGGAGGGNGGAGHRDGSVRRRRPRFRLPRVREVPRQGRRGPLDRGRRQRRRAVRAGRIPHRIQGAVARLLARPG